MLTLDPKTCFQKNAVIAFLVYRFESMEGPLCIDKAALQRIVYILQEIYSLPLGYDFALYNYGPYCANLTGDMEYTVYIGGIEEHYIPGTPAARATILKTGSKADSLLEEALDFLKAHPVSNLDETLLKLGNFESYELDILATLHMIYRELHEGERSREVLLLKLKEIKPRSHDQAVEKMMEFLILEKIILNGHRL